MEKLSALQDSLWLYSETEESLVTAGKLRESIAEQDEVLGNYHTILLNKEKNDGSFTLVNRVDINN